ncbi:MAG: hypothetical protein WCX65_06035 [bacterium]
MFPTVNIRSLFKIIDEESRDFRIGGALEWPRVSSPGVAKEPLRNPKRYTRVLDNPDEHLFYEFSTKFADIAVVQVDIRYTDNKDEFIPVGLVLGGAIPVPIDDNILFTEKAKQSITGEIRQRIFVPLARRQRAGTDWSNYIAWASSPRNWTPQVTALNYSTKAHDAGARLTLSAPLGGTSFVLQSPYGAQIVRKGDRTVIACRVVPVCAEGLLSRSWYFGLREAVYFLTVIKQSLKENAPAKFSDANKDVIRYPEPVIDRIAII